MEQALQIGGAILILVAFAGLQRGRMSARSRIYLVLNLAGALVLTVVAIMGRDWGFLVLELVWTVVSAWSLVQVMRGGQPTAAH